MKKNKLKRDVMCIFHVCLVYVAKGRAARVSVAWSIARDDRQSEIETKDPKVFKRTFETNMHE